MRVLALIGLGFALSLSALPAAQAQERLMERPPLRIDVKKRSYLDAGNVVPVGSLNRYASQHSTTSSPAWSFAGDRYGDSSLPSRIGAGTNPFANSFWGP
jgi:hypothetical protein